MPLVIFADQSFSQDFVSGNLEFLLWSFLCNSSDFRFPYLKGAGFALLPTVFPQVPSQLVFS